jgi:1,2-dihydroxy-3-keto-5-methylthiopentene dioxygenase
MAVLTIPDKGIQLTEFEEIKAYLAARNVWHDRWEASMPFAPDADQETVLAAYDHVLKPYMAQNGYQVADVIVVHPQMDNLDAIRAKFLKEHTHTEDEVRFFVDGKGYFWFNLGGDEPVFNVCCMAGDLLSVPAGIAHWFDMGEPAFVKAIRMFIDTSGWVPQYTETGVEQRYQTSSTPTA